MENNKAFKKAYKEHLEDNCVQGDYVFSIGFEEVAFELGDLLAEKGISSESLTEENFRDVLRSVKAALECIDVSGYIKDGILNSGIIKED